MKGDFLAISEWVFRKNFSGFSASFAARPRKISSLCFGQNSRYMKGEILAIFGRVFRKNFSDFSPSFAIRVCCRKHHMKKATARRCQYGRFFAVFSTRQARHNVTIVLLVGGISPKPPAKNRSAFFAFVGVPPPSFFGQLSPPQKQKTLSRSVCATRKARGKSEEQGRKGEKIFCVQGAA